MSPRIFLAEVNPSGHRLVYVRLIAERAAASGTRVTLGIPAEAEESPEFARHLGPIANQMDLVSIPGDASLRTIVDEARAAGAQHLVIPDGDAYLTQAARGRRSRDPRTTLLVMRDPRWEIWPGHVPPRALAKCAATALARRSVRLVFLREPGHSTDRGEHIAIDPLILDGSREQIHLDAATYRRAHGLDDRTFWFGVLGVLSERKNVPLVAAAAQQLARDAERPVGLALIGPTGADVSWERDDLVKASAAAGLSMMSDDALMTNYSMNVAVAALDCAVVAYSTNAPNSTMAKAAGLGVRLVVAGSPPLRRFAKSTTGAAGVPLQLGELGEAMRTAMSTPPPAARYLPGPTEFADALLGVGARSEHPGNGVQDGLGRSRGRPARQRRAT